jgi:hypothetical protein
MHSAESGNADEGALPGCIACMSSQRLGGVIPFQLKLGLAIAAADAIYVRPLASIGLAVNENLEPPYERRMGSHKDSDVSKSTTQPAGMIWTGADKRVYNVAK